MFLKWDGSKYSVKVAEMDREHEHLVGLMNRLHELYEAKAGRAAQGGALEALASYVVRHFADEEAYMQRIGYPELDTHRRVHRDLLAKVSAYGKDFAASGRLTPQFFEFLKVWLKAHICGVDSRYGSFAKAA